MRLEKDGLGELAIPKDSLFGIHTYRATKNFPISGTKLSDFPELIRSLALTKQAAAKANMLAGNLDNIRGTAIVAACEDVRDGQYHEAFVVDMIQGGAGTSTNMNANEVIANIALLRSQKRLGDYDFISPNDHVNMSQSTNDVYPTALRLAIVSNIRPLQLALRGLQEAFELKAAEFASVVKVGRTQLQDAVPMTLGSEFQAFAVTISEDIERLADVAPLLLEVNLGGTAIGTGINASKGYRQAVVPTLAALTGFDITGAKNLMEASSDLGVFVTFSGLLRRIAIKLSKICNDLRLLSSGPRAGLGEIMLPAVQAGSSIMPGKVNPVIPEVLNQIAYQIMGADLTVAMAAEAGQLQLNAMEPIAGYSILNSLRLLNNGINVLTQRCVAGIVANEEHCRKTLDQSLAVVTALVPVLGYEKSTEIAKRAMRDGSSVLTALQAMGVTDQAAIDILKETNTEFSLSQVAEMKHSRSLSN